VVESVYSEVRTDSLYKEDCVLSLKDSISLRNKLNVLVISNVKQTFNIPTKRTQNNVRKTIVDVEGKIRFGNLSILVWSRKTVVFSRRPVNSVIEVHIANIKNPPTPSFGGEVKPSVPCRRFSACKRSLNVPWKSCI
jgi:hypothetical protein